MDISLTINGLDLSKKLSTYRVTEEITYRKVITTLDDVEHPYPGAKRLIVTFALLPTTESENSKIYDALYPLIVPVVFTNSYTGKDETRRMRVTSDLDSLFLLLSVDGKRRYRGGTIQLRAI